MSAINEWFGYYNALFTHIKEKYGDSELSEYFTYLAKEAYSDITPTYREGGLEAISERYVTNFKKDGDEGSAKATIEDGILTIKVRCPAFTHSVKVRHSDKQVGPFFCECCKMLNAKILAEAGYKLEIIGGPRECTYKIVKDGDSEK